MQYDMIALDLDGTALSSKSEVQEDTRKAIAWAQARGVRVVLATGRICAEAAEFACALGAQDEMVTGGGAALGRASTGECWARMSMDWQTGAQAAALLQQQGFTAMTYIADRIVLTPAAAQAFGYYKVNEGYLSSKQVVPDVAAYITQKQVPVDKIFAYCTQPEKLQGVREALAQMRGLRVMSSGVNNVEVVAPQVNKGAALEKLCQGYGTTLARTIAIGDSENDIEMLQAVGMPVAMGNAPAHIQALAKYITADNDHGGVAQAIYHLLDNAEAQA